MTGKKQGSSASACISPEKNRFPGVKTINCARTKNSLFRGQQLPATGSEQEQASFRRTFTREKGDRQLTMTGPDQEQAQNRFCKG